jgi:1,4-dihydroxy-2-naphthoate octaprenyltransferase
MEESMRNQQRSTWRERLQIAAQIAAVISCMCGLTIAYYAHMNAQRAQAPAVTPQNHGHR